jgi:hypothetical protein
MASSDKRSSLCFRLFKQSPRHIVVHQVGVASPIIGGRTSILMEERHHRVGVTVVQRRRRPAARRRARHGWQPAQHHRLLLGPVAVLLLLLLLRQSVAADRRLPTQAIEALVVAGAVAMVDHVVSHAGALLKHLRGSRQVGDVHTELDQQRKVI